MARASFLTLRNAALAFCAVAICQPAVWGRLADGYAGDDFFTLSRSNQLLLATLSLTMIAIVCLIMAALSNAIMRTTVPAKMRALADATARASLFGALIWLSPQLYYSFYRLIIPGLPRQWVIRWPEAEGILTGLIFAADDRLALHVIAAMFWALLLLGVQIQTGSARITLAVYAGIAALTAGLRAIF